MPAHTEPFTLEGHKIIPIARACVYRPADKMIGHCSAHYKPATLADIRWYTPQQVADRARVPLPAIVARLKDRWNFADLIKPDGWERVVYARRNGVPMRDGTRMPVKAAAAHIRVDRLALEMRLFKGWTVHEYTKPGRIAPLELKRGALPPEGVPVAPLTGSAKARKGTAWGPKAVFFRDGRIDTFAGHCKVAGVKVSTARRRLLNGLPLDQVFSTERMTRSDKGVPNPKKGPRSWREPPPRADGSADPEYRKGDPIPW